MNYIRLISLFLLISTNLYAQHRDERNVYYYYNEFITNVGADVVGSEIFASNSGTSAGTTTGQASADRNVIGTALTTTGSTATGRAYAGTATNALTFGGASWIYELRIDSISALSSIGQRYQLAIGFIDNTAVNMTDAVYFLYDEGGVTSGSAASANWQCVAADAGTKEFTTTSTPVVTNGTTFRIEINNDGTEAIYYIDGVEVDRNSTYIPTTPLTEVCGFGWLLVKSIGNTAVTCAIDYLMVEARYNTPK